MNILDEFIGSADKLRVSDIIVLQHQRRVAEYHRDEEIRRNQYSASKSFTSTAVGIAIGEGLFTLEDYVCDFFAEELPRDVSDNLKKLTVRDLLTMCLGQDKSYLMGGQRCRLKERDWVRYALSMPFTYNPGEKFCYNNVGPYLAGVIVQKKAGCNLVDYLMPRLFEPLDILRPTWEVDPLGRTFGAGGLFLAASDMAKFGQLYLQKGKWNGRQLVGESWVREATKKQVETSGRGDAGMGYGYLFWRGQNNSYRADGKYGQYVIVLNEKETVITVNADSYEAGKILACIWDTVYPLLE